MGCNASIKETVGQMPVGKAFPLGERARGRVQGTAGTMHRHLRRTARGRQEHRGLLPHGHSKPHTLRIADIFSFSVLGVRSLKRYQWGWMPS